VLCLAFLLSASAVGLAQQPAKDWHNLETIKPGASIRITLAGQRTLCAFDSVTEDAIVCHKRRAGVDRSLSFPRADIHQIRARNATGSIIVGAALGAGVGAGIGAIVDSGIKNPNTNNNAKFTGGLARAGGLLGALFGIATEFVPGKLLYKAESHRP
jgi:hypothetical protein